MSEITRGEFRNLTKSISTEDVGAISEWLENFVIPRFEGDFNRAVDEIHAAVMENEQTAPALYEDQINDISEKIPALGTALHNCLPNNPKI